MDSRIRWLPYVLLAAAWLCFAALGAPHLFEPPSGEHALRQVITATEARLYAEGQPFLYPRAESCGTEPDRFIPSEFPLYAWALGRAGGPWIHVAGRLFGLASTFALMLSVFAIARNLLRGWDEPYRSSAGLGAASLFALSPMQHFYGISTIPDGAAHALCLLGAALLSGPLFSREAGPGPLSLPRVLAASALLALGCLTKPSALPHLALAGALLVDRSRDTQGLRGLGARRALLYGGLSAGAAIISVFLWYGRWVPVLEAGGCPILQRPEGIEDLWQTRVLAQPEWYRAVASWSATYLLGPLWPLCLVGVALFLLGGLQGTLLAAWAFACAVGVSRLGWGVPERNYELLLMLPPFAMGFGIAVGLVTWVAGWLRRQLPERLHGRARAMAATLSAVGFGLLALGAQRAARPLFGAGPGEVDLERALDRVLPRGEAIHTLEPQGDPRVAYYARRRTWATEPQLFCQRRQVQHDCALAAAAADPARAPCSERPPSVVWPRRSLTCGMERSGERQVPARILETVARGIRWPTDQKIAGLGRLIGSDWFRCGGRSLCPPALGGRALLDLYVVAAPQRAKVELLADGASLPLDPPPESWIAGALTVVRARLPERSLSLLQLKVEAQLISLPVPYPGGAGTKRVARGFGPRTSRFGQNPGSQGAIQALPGVLGPKVRSPGLCHPI